MAKEVTGIIRLQIPAGQANPAPPVGPALGQQGVNIMAFCKEFNAATQKPGSGSKEPNKVKIGKVTMKQVRELAEQKMPDMNCTDIESAIQTVMGTARSMGIDVVEA